jgi:hypothetical protein
MAGLTEKVAVIDVRPREARVFAPIRTRAELVALPRGERRWDPDLECWVVSLRLVDRVVQALTGLGLEVDVMRGDQVRTIRPAARGAA